MKIKGLIILGLVTVFSLSACSDNVFSKLFGKNSSSSADQNNNSLRYSLDFSEGTYTYGIFPQSQAERDVLEEAYENNKENKIKDISNYESKDLDIEMLNYYLTYTEDKGGMYKGYSDYKLYKINNNYYYGMAPEYYWLTHWSEIEYKKECKMFKIEPIKWNVLVDRENGEVDLISELSLLPALYKNENIIPVSQEEIFALTDYLSSDIRNALNNAFLRFAFQKDSKDLINAERQTDDGTNRVFHDPVTLPTVEEIGYHGTHLLSYFLAVDFFDYKDNVYDMSDIKSATSFTRTPVVKYDEFTGYIFGYTSSNQNGNYRQELTVSTVSAISPVIRVKGGNA